MLIASIVLLGAATVAVALLAKNGPSDREFGPGTHTANASAAISSDVIATDQIERLRRQVRVVAEQYVAAVIAQDETAAARFTCRKLDGSRLWGSAAGRRISILDVLIGGPYADGIASASVSVQVEAEPPTGIGLIWKDGEWCVHP